ncbi:dephospho-CoA kinase [bacterium]|nr:dephospho-CoA kinase [bacterium]
MKIVGLTGGIGSGKSLVARVFEVLGVPVYSADEAGRRLLNQSAEVKKEVLAIFGRDAYTDNAADRAYIASQVFESQDKLDALNRIIHPAVRQDFSEWKSLQVRKGKQTCIRESAILFESNTSADCDLIIAVTASQDIRLKRTMKRDGSSEAEVRMRMEKQMNQDLVAEKSDVCIDNAGAAALIPQITSICRDHSL